MILLLAACADTLARPDWDGGVFLELSGPIEGDVDVSDATVWAMGVWTWVREDRVGAAAVPLPFEPEIQGYRVGIAHPPEPEVGDVIAPPDLQRLGAATVLVGTVVLVAGPDVPPDLEVEPVPTLAALLDGVTPTTLRSDAGFEVVAGWPAHRLAALGEAGDAQRVDALPGWTGEPCELAGVAPGVALYALGPCPWEPVAPAGAESRIDGVPLAPP
ncbi:MAG: hypothetical protein H6737_27940 [Alphaproteobacteria bacterium]|nr:hypothetical protein [Alphaproteobacteria bacterium]